MSETLYMQIVRHRALLRRASAEVLAADMDRLVDVRRLRRALDALRDALVATEMPELDADDE